MKKKLVIIGSVLFVLITVTLISAFKSEISILNSQENKLPSKSFYQYSFKTTDGKEIKMQEFKGKIILIVNTATKCGLAPQFKSLEKLHQKYKNKGLVIIGFPCNQFHDQEPETNKSMVNVCKKNFGVTFLLTEKIDVNGENTHPLYVYLKQQLHGNFGNDIKWNFTKFLITSEGKPYKRYAPTTKPESFEEDIVALLNQKNRK